jgi:hypothetical protein
VIDLIHVANLVIGPLIDFEYDVSLIFKNCDKYNGAKNNIHMVTLGKYTAKVFR